MSDFAIKATSGLLSVTGVHPKQDAPIAGERQSRVEGGNVLPPATAKQSVVAPGSDREKDLSKLLESRATELHFQPSEVAQRTLITVLDKASGEIVRQTPSKAMVAIAAYIEQYLADVSPDSAANPSIDDAES